MGTFRRVCFKCGSAENLDIAFYNPDGTAEWMCQKCKEKFRVCFKCGSTENLHIAFYNPDGTAEWICRKCKLRLACETRKWVWEDRRKRRLAKGHDVEE